ncbi:hypothetical protein AB1Y20_022991 [Prymnesium parvum]|uniref:Fibrous sheath-interacting protein 1 n=1 Tax=Prymnesium parvum TaxID=97485 RepID=A0AB34JFC8_PRYPA
MGGERLSAEDARRQKLWFQLKYMLERSREVRRGRKHVQSFLGASSVPPSHRTSRPTSSRSRSLATEPSLLELEANAQLSRARQQARRQHDWQALSRLSTREGVAAFLRLHRRMTYSPSQLRMTVGAELPQSEIATQTEPTSEDAPDGAVMQGQSAAEKSCVLLARDEQSLEHLAEADLAYLEMVRTKSDMHHPMAGAMASASEAEQALAESWKKLIELRLKSQKLQLRQRANPMSPGDMQRVEAELMHETNRIASELQHQLQHLTTQERNESSDALDSSDPSSTVQLASGEAVAQAEGTQADSTEEPTFRLLALENGAEQPAAPPPAQLETMQLGPWGQWNGTARGRTMRGAYVREVLPQRHEREIASTRRAHSARASRASPHAVKGARAPESHASAKRTSRCRERAVANGRASSAPRCTRRRENGAAPVSPARRSPPVEFNRHSTAAAGREGIRGALVSDTTVQRVVSRMEEELRKEDMELNRMQPRLRELSSSSRTGQGPSQRELQKLHSDLMKSHDWLDAMLAKLSELRVSARGDDTEAVEGSHTVAGAAPPKQGKRPKHLQRQTHNNGGAAAGGSSSQPRAVRKAANGIK